MYLTFLSIDVSKITRLISITSIARSIHWFFSFSSSGISIKSFTTVVGLGRVDRPFSVERFLIFLLFLLSFSNRFGLRVPISVSVNIRHLHQ